jgi:hypothetical protein
MSVRYDEESNTGHMMPGVAESLLLHDDDDDVQ